MDQTQTVVRLVDDVLGDAVIGTYLHGSSVLGGLKPASDLDFLVVTHRRMDDRQRLLLTRELLKVSGDPAGARGVELTVVVQPEVRPWRFPPTGDYLYGEWLRDELATHGAAPPQPMPDLAVLIAVALTGDHPLSGPPPARVLDPVPHSDVVRASVEGIAELLNELDSDTRNVLLTFARIWVTVATGDIRSKDAAADWALARLPPECRPALEYARHLYLNCSYAEENWSDELRARVRPYVDHVLEEVHRLTGH
ncbi:aminoglycoside adenylyltransferase family protein [Rugosimonospora africana]|nr:aminoglycoside adenylyltransferase family protein [Rugosimonospora africana]